MINIVVKENSPRLTYTCEMIFKNLLNTGFRVIERRIFDLKINTVESQPHINYSGKPIDNTIFIPNSGFLAQKGTDPVDVNCNTEGEIVKLFVNDKANPEDDLDFDIFSATFWLLSEYEKYSLEKYDLHRRYDENELLLVKNKLFLKPWVNHYAILLRTLLNEKFGLNLVEENSFDYRISVDVDMPWAYLHKGIKTYAGLLKDLFKFDFKNFSYRFNAIKTGQDPYDNFPFLFENCPVDKSLFFFLIDGLTRYDKFYDYRNPHYRQLIKDVHEKGYKTGIHPSYVSSKSSRIMGFEKDKFEDIIGKKVVRSRQHYLKYRLPETYTNLVYNGIIHDYTSVMANNPGFKYCIARPFKWFDLASNVMTRLTIHPTMAMDSCLKDYLKQKPEEAFETIKTLVDETENVAGRFILLWHNSSLQDAFGWIGWKDTFLKTLDYLKSKSGKFKE